MTSLSPALDSLRVAYTFNLPCEPIYIPVATPAEAARVIDALAARDLGDPKIESNFFRLERFDGSEWSDWETEDGLFIDDVEADLLAKHFPHVC